MWRFSIGEEVVLDDEVFVVSTRLDGPPPHYRLLASRPEGTRFILAQEGELSRPERYLASRDDTSSA